VVIGIMIVKQLTKKKKENKFTLSDPFYSEPVDSENQDPIEELSDINKIEKDSEYSEHIEEAEIVEDEIDVDEPVEETKTDEKDKEE
ncbi:MAG: signal peptidase I, partial [Nitrosopumilus sp.]